ncbi:MAG TPA: DNA methyltransferase [Sphingobacterium sp.]|nr:DNA methyltransferase [Sphingobacterium sp.]
MTPKELIKNKKKFKPVTAKAHTPPYKIHRYFARRPWNLFESLIKHHSPEGGVVLDPFCGGGVTPYEGIKTGRKVIACDINPLSNFIVNNMFHNDLSKDLLTAYDEVMKYLKKISADSFTVTCSECNKDTAVEWYELAHTTACNLCDSSITLLEKNKIRNGIYKCSNQKCWGGKTGVSVARSKRKEPVYLSAHGKCQNCNSKFSVEVDGVLLDSNRAHASKLRREVKKNNAEFPDELIPLEWDRQKEDLLSEKGIATFQDFFTKKNLYINYLLLNKIKEYKNKKDVYSILRFIFSDSLRDTNIMTFTNGTWQNGTPTSWAKHAYWLPAQFCEVSVLKSFGKSFESIKKAIEFNKSVGITMKRAKRVDDLKGAANLYIHTGVLKEMKLPAKSVDAVITDPPYGSNVQYLELSHFWFPWNKDVYESDNIDYSKEAVVNRKKTIKNAKTYKTYEDSLYEVFSESHRVLKDSGYIIMTFNNKDLKAWLALLISLFRSGYHFEPGGITFQDGVSNYRHTAHTKAEGSPYGDFVYEFIKDTPTLVNNLSQIDRDQLVAYIKNEISSAIKKYKKGEKDRNTILVELFNKIVPEIESFVRISKTRGVIDDLYEIFTQSHLEPLYVAA